MLPTFTTKREVKIIVIILLLIIIVIVIQASKRPVIFPCYEK